MSRACPPAREVERSAAMPAPGAGLAEHLRTCERCREIYDAAKFESAFASALRDSPRRIENGPPEIAGYEIVREVSRGGQGIVYEAIQQRTRRRVAIKVLRQDYPVSPASRARFEREIEIAAALKHPGIVAVYDSIAMPQGRFALVLEYVVGHELDYSIAPAGDAERRARLEQIAELCDAVHYAHQKGVIHRDLKPSNVIVDETGRPRVLDFGVARWSSNLDEQRGRITMTGEFAGTLAYAAPEQVSGSGGPPDLRSDVYALGVMLYQATFGALPYSVEGVLDSAIWNIANAPPSRPAGGLRANEDLWTIIHKALSKAPERRYQSAGALAADLRRYLEGETIEARRDSRWYVVRKSLWRHRVGVGVLAGVAVGLVAFGMVQTLSNQRLGAALRTSAIERARALGAAGSRPQADGVIWRELLSLADSPLELAEALFGGSSDERRALWAFSEIQGAYPCLKSITLESEATAASCSADECIVATSNGFIHRWAMPGLTHCESMIVADADSRIQAVSSAGCIGLAFGNARMTVFDIATGQVLQRGEWRSAIAGARMDASGSAAVVWSDFDVSVFELPSLRRMFSDFSERRAIGISHEGDSTLYVGRDDVAHVHSVKLNKEVAAFGFGPNHDSIAEYPFGIMGTNLGISKSQNLGAIGFSRNLVVCNLDTGDHMQRFRITSGDAAVPMFAPTGRWITVSSAGDPNVEILRTSDWSRLAMLCGHEGGARVTAIADDESYVITCDYNRSLRLWPRPGSGACADLEDSIVQPHDISFDRASREIWASDSRGFVRCWGGLGRREPWMLRADAACATTLARAATKSLGAAGGFDGVLSVFRTSDLFLLRSIHLEGDGGIAHARFNPEESLLAVGMRGGRIALLRTDSWEQVAATRLAVARLVQLRWSPNGEFLAVAAANGRCHVLDGRSLRPVIDFECHKPRCRAAEFSPDGRLLATTGDDGMVRLWNSKTWKLEREIGFGTTVGYALAFHEKGKVLAIGDRIGRLTIVDVENGRLLAGFDEGEAITALQFAGDRLAVASFERPIRIWDFEMMAKSLAGNWEYWKERLADQPE
ncbi:MAG: protein kinase [Phycisphaeraceae bacterium]|nr:protein kinase [Phycisphaeraceae bacterium]